MISLHDGGVYHRDLGPRTILVKNHAGKDTYGPDDIYFVGYENAGGVSSRFRREVPYFSATML